MLVERAEGIPRAKELVVTMSTERRRLIFFVHRCAIIGSRADTCEVSAAIKIKKKKAIESTCPPGIDEKIVGRVSKISPGPKLISIWAEKTILRMQKAARSDTIVSQPITKKEFDRILSSFFK